MAPQKFIESNKYQQTDPCLLKICALFKYSSIKYEWMAKLCIIWWVDL